MTTDRTGRRRFLYRAGVVAAGGALAGCIGGSDASGDSGGDSNNTRPVTKPAPERVDEFLEDASFYDGNMVVGVSLVAVGARRNGRTGFDPAAINIATGTEVTWEWANDRAPHSVMSVGTPNAATQTFDSGEPQKGTNVTFRYTFEEPGFYPYVCGAHRAQEAFGVVLVEEGQNVGGPGSG